MPRARILLIIPAWNEAEALPDTLREVQETLPGVDVVVVDDGSTDPTAATARAHGVPVLQLPFNLGVGGAMRAGYRHAVRQGYEVAVQLDADGQHDPRSVPDLVAALEGADLVIGARFAGPGGYRVRGPRRWAMTLLAVLISRLSRTRLTDTTSGMKATNEVGTAFFARHMPAEYLGDTVEALVLAARAGLSVREVPVTMRPRRRGSASQAPVTSAAFLFRAMAALGMTLLRRPSVVRGSAT